MNIVTLIDAILVMVVVEAVGLIAFKRLTGRGMAVAEVLAFLAAGGGLLLGVRVLASGAAFGWFAAAMLAALLTHLWHIRQRWQH